MDGLQKTAEIKTWEIVPNYFCRLCYSQARQSPNGVHWGCEKCGMPVGNLEHAFGRFVPGQKPDLGPKTADRSSAIGSYVVPAFPMLDASMQTLAIEIMVDVNLLAGAIHIMEAGLEYAEMVRDDHEQRLGRTTRKNRQTGEAIDKDILEMRSTISKCREIMGLEVGGAPPMGDKSISKEENSDGQAINFQAPGATGEGQIFNMLKESEAKIVEYLKGIQPDERVIETATGPFYGRCGTTYRSEQPGPTLGAMCVRWDDQGDGTIGTSITAGTRRISEQPGTPARVWWKSPSGFKCTEVLPESIAGDTAVRLSRKSTFEHWLLPVGKVPPGYVAPKEPPSIVVTETIVAVMKELMRHIRLWDETASNGGETSAKLAKEHRAVIFKVELAALPILQNLAGPIFGLLPEHLQAKVNLADVDREWKLQSRKERENDWDARLFARKEAAAKILGMVEDLQKLDGSAIPPADLEFLRLEAEILKEQTAEDYERF